VVASGGGSAEAEVGGEDVQVERVRLEARDVGQGAPHAVLVDQEDAGGLALQLLRDPGVGRAAGLRGLDGDRVLDLLVGLGVAVVGDVVPAVADPVGEQVSTGIFTLTPS
jgi:hypothetical protein